MYNLVRFVHTPDEISAAAAGIREAVGATHVTPNVVLDVFESWSVALGARELADIPGVQFLRMWLRRRTLEPIVIRELGREALCGTWQEEGRARLRAYPLGVVGHWPAANVEIQALLSMTCALVGGNGSLVRVPSGLEDPTRRLLDALAQVDCGGVLTRRICVLAFDHARRDLQEGMARVVDGAMIWGGAESILQVRGLPFPHWARLAVFGPRISVAAIDAGCWANTAERAAWCRRIARDVWQFDQKACSSPQVLFLERSASRSCDEFIADLKTAFEAENRLHPRETIPASLTTAICQVRASWLLQDTGNRAYFTRGPDWTILVGSGSEIPIPTQGKTLTVLEVEDLLDPIRELDGNVQTIGLAIGNPARETELAAAAASKGVDRIVKLGRMHAFTPPWDGVDLIRPMVRVVRHVPSAELIN